MSKLIQAIVSGKCTKCNTKLPPLKREGSSWGVVDCPNTNCNEWFNVYKYMKTGGKEI